jgi:hypothetical protein
MSEDQEYPTPWTLEVFERIDGSATLKRALVIAASHLSDLLDEMVPVMEPDGMLETQYSQFCSLRKREIRPDGSDLNEEYIFVWECAEEMFSLYERLPHMSDLEAELEAINAFAPDFDLEIEKEDVVRNLFAHVICYIEAQKDSELARTTPRTLRQLTFEGPGFDPEGYFPYHWSWFLTPEPDYPESMEELESWMKGK